MAEMPEETIVEEPMTEEESDAQLVDKVAKMLHPEDTPAEKAETPAPEAEEPVEDEEETAEPIEFTDELKSRVEQAGLDQELAEQLHKSGQLNGILRAIDKKIVDYVQSQEKSAEEGQREKEPQSKEETPALDPETYDEVIIQRDALHQKRIDALEAKLDALLQDRQSEFDEWFDGVITQLGGDVNNQDDCQAIFRMYGSLCHGFGIDPESKNVGMASRAYEQVHPEKEAKRKVDRLRDAEGKFLSKSPAKEPPPSRRMTEEESHDALVARVTGYLKEQGVQMYGY